MITPVIAQFSPGPAQLTAVALTASTTTFTVIAASGTKVISVYKMMICTGSIQTNVTFQSTTTSFTGSMALNANATLTMQFDGEPMFVGTAGANLQISQTPSTATTTGTIWYTQQ